VTAVVACLCLGATVALGAGTPGALDTTFGGGDGLATLPSGTTSAPSLLAQPIAGGQRYLAVGNRSPSGWRVSALTSEGGPDSTFGTLPAGITDPVGSGVAQHAALDAEGRVLVAGWSDVVTTVVGNKGKTTTTTTRYATLVRLTADGRPDTTFGSSANGIVRLAAGQYGNAVAMTPEGKIVFLGQKSDFVEGTTSNGTPIKNNHLFLARFTGTGQLDATFGTNGVAYDPLATTALSKCLGFQADGRIVVGHQIRTGLVTSSYHVVSCYTATGALDTSFGVSGRAVYGGAKALTCLVVDPADDGIVTGAYRTSGDTAVREERDLVFTRLTRNGAPDAAFGTNGVAVLEYAPWANTGTSGLALDGGNIVFCAQVSDGTSANTKQTVGRLLPDGRLDSSFGTGGFGTLVGPGGSAHSVAVAADGYLLGGGYSVSMAPVVYIARFGR